MMEGEINALDASLNLMQSSPALMMSGENTEAIFTAQPMSEEVASGRPAAGDVKVTDYFSRIKKRMRNRSTNIL